MALPVNTGLQKGPLISAVERGESRGFECHEKSPAGSRGSHHPSLDVDGLLVEADSRRQAAVRCPRRRAGIADLEHVPIERELDRSLLRSGSRRASGRAARPSLDDQLIDIVSSPTTRIVPPTMAVVNGESRGSKNRT